MAVRLPPSPRVSPERRQHAEEIIASLIAQHPLCVIVFGLWAGGMADDHSDLDIVVIKQTTERFLRRLDDWNFPVRMAADILVYTPEEIDDMRKRGNPFLERIPREGVTLYARSKRMMVANDGG